MLTIPGHTNQTIARFGAFNNLKHFRIPLPDVANNLEFKPGIALRFSAKPCSVES